MCPRNDTVNEINKLILEKIPGQVKHYKSIDKIVSTGTMNNCGSGGSAMATGGGPYDAKIAGLYDLLDTLGSGHFAVVKSARHVFTGEKVAVKVIDKSKLDEVSKSHLFQENDDLEKKDAKSLKENQFLGEESHQKLEQEPFVSNKDLKRVESSSNRIQILENRLITFEELLLMQVKAGANEKFKRQKIAPGAEVITHDDVVKCKMEEKIKNIKKEPQTNKNVTMIKKQPKTNNLKKKEHKKTQRKVPSNEMTPDIMSDEDADMTPKRDTSFYGPSTLTGKTGMKKKLNETAHHQLIL
ncbi:unnamed protein product [Parnassius apollo]|uniref:(apollo) hypothetical protein n=1 Tax=Parnassius apollo TaxID=110799 RepID=A0A8S3W8T9_PARAO|nr:unnamed protein product [Parnassius apollo]